MSGARGYVVVGAVVLLFVYALHRALRPDLGKRNLETFTEMVYSKAFESFSPSPILPGGMTQQPVVAGVVPRGPLPFPYGEGEEEGLRAGAELVSPFASDDAAAVKRGGEIFFTYCTPCHDGAGNGRGRAVERGMVAPPSLHGARAMEMADGQVFHILTRGQKNMASYAAQLTPEERWSVILHVRQLQKETQQ